MKCEHPQWPDGVDPARCGSPAQVVEGAACRQQYSACSDSAAAAEDGGGVGGGGGGIKLGGRLGR